MGQQKDTTTIECQENDRGSVERICDFINPPTMIVGGWFWERHYIEIIGGTLESFSVQVLMMLKAIVVNGTCLL